MIAPRDHAVEARARADRADQQHARAAPRAIERAVVEADDVGQQARAARALRAHGARPDLEVERRLRKRLVREREVPPLLRVGRRSRASPSPSAAAARLRRASADTPASAACARSSKQSNVVPMFRLAVGRQRPSTVRQSAAAPPRRPLRHRRDQRQVDGAAAAVARARGDVAALEQLAPRARPDCARVRSRARRRATRRRSRRPRAAAGSSRRPSARAPNAATSAERAASARAAGFVSRQRAAP